MGREDLRKEAQAFHSKKRLGQNFLVNPDALAKIVTLAKCHPGDHVLEIGPGLGFLTRALLDAGACVTAVELDKECVQALKDRSLAGLSLIHQDFLQSDLNTILKEKTKVVGNVPYQITTPILSKLLGEIGAPSPWLPSIESIVLTVQKEVAQRLVAKAGEEHYSQISLLIQYFAQAEMLMTIAADDFFPVPEITSAVVRLVPIGQPPIVCRDHKLLRQIISAGFKQRRKMLKNNLSFLHLDQELIMASFSRLNFDPQVRAERLGLKEFALLADELSSMRNKANGAVKASV
jgi:16S rRNA (adenine1518-N6/adenine1519-N6)-dimethyltransferase